MMSVDLSATEFDVCWAVSELGERPPTVDVPFRGHTDDERHGIVRTVMDRPRARGLTEGNQIDRDLVDLLSVLTRFDLAIEVWLLIDRHPVRAIAARSGRSAALVSVNGDTVRVRELRAERLLTDVVELLDLAPGPGSPVTVPAATLDSAYRVAGAEVAAMTEALVRRGVRLDDARMLRQMCADHDRLGQVAVLTRFAGRVTVARSVLGLHGTSTGWYTQVRAVDTMTIAPATPERMHAALDRLTSAVRR